MNLTINVFFKLINRKYLSHMVFIYWVVRFQSNGPVSWIPVHYSDANLNTDWYSLFRSWLKEYWSFQQPDNYQASEYRTSQVFRSPLSHSHKVQTQASSDHSLFLTEVRFVFNGVKIIIVKTNALSYSQQWLRIWYWYGNFQKIFCVLSNAKIRS